jgi:sugar transferase EpsL
LEETLGKWAWAMDIQRILKRGLDIVVAAAAMVALSPVLLCVATLVRLSMGTPVLFRQRRPGLHGEPFLMYKFRTMRDARDAQGRLLPDGERLTGLGHFLRSTSLDELPELANVLRGEMSLVGPRPLLMEYLGRYSPEQSHRHDVKPGITGWAQVHGRNAIDWEQKFSLDLWYVEHCNLWLDARILLTTVWGLCSRRGISAPAHPTMPEFTGSTFHRGDPI